MRKRIRELEEALTKVQPGSLEEIDLKNRVAWETWGSDPERSAQLSAEALEASKTLNYEKGIVCAEMNIGVSLWQTEIEAGMPKLLRGLQWALENKDLRIEANARAILGVLYWGFGDFQQGFDFSEKALALYEDLDDIDGQGWLNSALGRYYYDLGNYEKSLEYFERSSAIWEMTDHIVGKSASLTGIGNAYRLKGDYDRALEFLNRGLKIQQSESHPFSISRTLNDLGLLYQNMGDLETALDFHKQSLAIREEMEYLTGMTTNLMDIGDIYAKQKKYDQAIEKHLTAIDYSEKIKAKPKIVRSLTALAGIYEKLGDTEQALKYYKELHQKDSEIFREDAEQKLKNMRTAYQVEASEKEKEIFRLRNVELKEKNVQLETTLRELNAAQAQLLQSGKMAALGNLVAGLAHEINNPLGTIKSGQDISRRIADKLKAILEQSDETDEKWQADFRKALKVLDSNNQNAQLASDRIASIVNSLKDFSNLDQAEFVKADLHEALETTLNLIGHKVVGNVEVKRQFGDLPEIYCFVNELNQVFMNILLNALAAVDQESGVVDIITELTDNMVRIEIRDNGKGIPEDKVAGLFEPSFVSDGNRIKMRTGLYTSLNIINRHFGHLDVISSLGDGTRITIEIPADLEKQQSKLDVNAAS